MLPYYGHIPRVKSIHDRAFDDVKKATRVLDDHLKKNGGQFIVGQKLTLADIAVATTLAAPLQYVWDEKYRKSIQAVTKWFQAITADETWKKSFGRAILCTKAVDVFATEKEEEEEVKKEEPKKEAKKEAPKKEAATTSKPKPADDEDEGEKKTEKEKNPLDELPPSTFNLFDYKTLFVNAPNKKDAMDFFWKNFDANGYSIYNVLYDKAEGEGKVLFLTSNLMNGFLQRLDHFRKYAFAVHGVYGEEKNYEIRGVWVWRGKGIPKEITDLDSYEYHKWIPLDPSKDEDRKKVDEYWCGLEEDVDVVDGLVARAVKYFK